MGNEEMAREEKRKDVTKLITRRIKGKTKKSDRYFRDIKHDTVLQLDGYCLKFVKRK